MRKFFNYIVPVLLAALALFTACDNIPEDDRLIYIKPAAVSRAVLIEDFTGQRCVNCPAASEVIHQLQQEYGDSVVIAVGIHSGPFGASTPLRTDEGDQYYAHWQVQEQPSGMVNSTGLSLHTTWAAKVYEQIQQTAAVSIKLETTLDADTRKLDVVTDMMAVDGNVAGKLQLWLIEDGIVSLQLFPGNARDFDYVHNHVFRTSINGTWGEDVAMAEGETAQKMSSITISDDYVLENLRVVAFVYNNTGVLQATQTKIVSN